jgi:hypothetical protein
MRCRHQDPLALLRQILQRNQHRNILRLPTPASASALLFYALFSPAPDTILGRVYVLLIQVYGLECPDAISCLPI